MLLIGTKIMKLSMAVILHYYTECVTSES